MTRREKAIDNQSDIIEILNTGRTLHLGACVDEQPYVFPLNYGYELDQEKLVLYFHGSKKGYKYEILEKNPNVYFTIESDVKPFEGDVACKYGVSYRMIYGKGRAEFVTDVEEKKKALSLLMKTQTGKDFDFTDKLTTVVNVVRIEITSFEAKERPYPEK